VYSAEISVIVTSAVSAISWMLSSLVCIDKE
jgi:hypothetical protein